MTSKWDSNGDITWSDSDVLYAADLENTLEYACVPIGGIIPWAKSFTGVPSMPDGYLECDGSTISDANSPLNGETLPDLNGNNNFLRGNSTSGGTGGGATHNHSLTSTGQDVGQPGGAFNWHDLLQPASNLPPYYEIVWIMRVK